MQVTFYEDLPTVYAKFPSCPRINLTSNSHEGLCGLRTEGPHTLMPNDLRDAGDNLTNKGGGT